MTRELPDDLTINPIMTMSDEEAEQAFALLFNRTPDSEETGVYLRRLILLKMALNEEELNRLRGSRGIGMQLDSDDNEGGMFAERARR